MNAVDGGIRFSIAARAAWAPGVETAEAWLEWSSGHRPIEGDREPAVRAMAPMLRRRAGFLDKMALEVAYRCLGDRCDVPTVFSSRHGETSRSVDLLTDLAKGLPLSPTTFGLSVHNAAGGLFFGWRFWAGLRLLRRSMRRTKIVMNNPLPGPG